MTENRYVVMMRHWNGHGYDEYGRDVKTKKNAADLVLWCLKTLSPYQISITDTEGPDPMPNPGAKEFKKDWVRIKTE